MPHAFYQIPTLPHRKTSFFSIFIALSERGSRPPWRGALPEAPIARPGQEKEIASAGRHQWEEAVYTILAVSKRGLQNN